MQIDGINLFPLSHAVSQGRGYFMDAAGEVYSTKAHPVGKLKLLRGTRNGYGTRQFNFDGVLYAQSYLLSRAVNHPLWSSELGLTPPAPEPVVQAIIKRVHAPSLLEGVREHGVIIATLNDQGRLILGSEPKVHLTEDSWKSEIQRLAVLKPGTRFVALKAVTSVVAKGLEWE